MCAFIFYLKIFTDGDFLTSNRKLFQSFGAAQANAQSPSLIFVLIDGIYRVLWFIHLTLNLKIEGLNLSPVLMLFGKTLIRICHYPTRCKCVPGNAGVITIAGSAGRLALILMWLPLFTNRKGNITTVYNIIIMTSSSLSSLSFYKIVVLPFVTDP